MNKLDRLLELEILLDKRGYIEFNEAMKLEHEYESLKAEIQGLIDIGDSDLGIMTCDLINENTKLREENEDNRECASNCLNFAVENTKLKEDIENGTSHLERLIDKYDIVREELGQLKLTLDKINGLTYHVGCQQSPKCVWCMIQRLAKHEGNTDTKSDLSKCIGMKQ